MSSAEMPDENAGRPEGNSGAESRATSGEDIGSLAEEAAKLAGAFATWARENGVRAGHQAHDWGTAFSDGAHAVADDLNEHLATGAQECTTCPVCRTVSAVREVSPEVRQHLAVAAGSLISAAGGLLAAFNAAGRPPEGPESGRGSRGTSGPSAASGAAGEGVERIDLDE